MTEVISIEVGAARRLTERIRLIARSVSDNVEKLRELVAEAKETNAHAALGYDSWTAYIRDVFGDEPLRLARDVRQELVAELSVQGMSTRAIAPIVGVTPMQVSRDIHQTAVVTNVTPARRTEHTDEQWQAYADEMNVDPGTGEVAEPSTTTETVTKVITGLDGKSYAAPTKRVDRRSSIIDSARTAGWDLRKAIERIERLTADDRFTKNKVEIMAALQPHLDFATETINGL